MNELYPLKFKPIFKDKIWGGQKIKSLLGMDFGNLPNCGEAWIISGVQGNETIVENGFLAENELNELVEIYMGDLVGDKVFELFGNEFPILIKIIDSNDWLSVQVHPDDTLAQERGFSNGKTEMWYVMDADKKAEIITGFNKKIDRDIFVKSLAGNTLKDFLKSVKPEKGDVFFTPAGRIHAIGPGVMLAEIQQTSDVTYRIYDWDRLGTDGKSRDMHVLDSLDAIDFDAVLNPKTTYSPKLNKTVDVIDSEYFTTNLLEYNSIIKKDYTEIDSFVILICVEGKFAVKANELVQLSAGEAVLIPNALHKIEMVANGQARLLEVYVK